MNRSVVAVFDPGENEAERERGGYRPRLLSLAQRPALADLLLSRLGQLLQPNHAFAAQELDQVLDHADEFDVRLLHHHPGGNLLDLIHRAPLLRSALGRRRRADPGKPPLFRRSKQRPVDCRPECLVKLLAVKDHGRGEVAMAGRYPTR